MRPGRSAGDEGGPGSAAGRGALLLAAAVLIGALVLNQLDEPAPGTGITAGATRTTEAPDDATTTTAPPTTQPLREPRAVTVLVANASGVSRAGARVNDRLRPKLWNVLPATDAKQITVPAFIYHVAGYEREAQKIAEELAVPLTQVQPIPTPPPVADLKGAHILVLVGPQLAQASTPTTAAGTATTARPAAGATTTARPAATTTAKP